MYEKTDHKQHQSLFPVPMGTLRMVALELSVCSQVKCVLFVNKVLLIHCFHVSQYCGHAQII